MRRPYVFGLSALIIFSVSFGFSYLSAPETSTANEPRLLDRTITGGGNSTKPPTVRGEKTGNEPLPTARPPLSGVEVRTTSLPGAEVPTELARRYQADLKSLNAKKEEFESYKKTMSEQVSADIQRLQAEDDRLAARINSLLDRLEAEVAAREGKRSDGKLNQIEKPTSTSASSEEMNPKQLAALLEVVPAENGASILKEVVQGGKSDLAVQSLVAVKERKHAEILAKMEDKVLAARLLEGAMKLKRQNTGTKR